LDHLAMGGDEVVGRDFVIGGTQDPLCRIAVGHRGVMDHNEVGPRVVTSRPEIGGCHLADQLPLERAAAM
jgi:hypothetical protein